MATPLLTLRNITLSFGGEPVLEDISLSIEPGQRICLVGRNGCGKSTLMNIMAGLIEADGGERLIPPGLVIGYLPQRVDHLPEDTVYDYVGRRLKRYEEEENPLYRMDMALQPFELSGHMKMDSLSGGQKRRAALAASLLEEPDILLLDEPTNHLDIGAIEWLEHYLNGFKGGLICISHDRSFLQAISNRTFWMRQGGLLSNPQGYQDFERWSEAVEEQEYQQLLKLGKKLEEENHWYQRGVTARRKRNVRRLSELKGLREKVRREKYRYRVNTATLDLPELTAEQANKLVVEFYGVSKSYGEKTLMENFSTRIMRGDKVGIVGKNGSGKSTFLNMIAGHLEPDSGRIRRGRSMLKFTQEITYFDQNRSEIDPLKTPWEVLCPSGGDQVVVRGSPRHVVGYLKDFMFDYDQAKSKVSILSGGQAGRLLLAKCLANPGTILIMDEPTNDLDMDTLDMLQEVLASYEGTLLLVSHDRDFIDRIVTRTLVFEGDGHIYDAVGGYSDYVAERKRALHKNRRKEAPADLPAEKTAPPAPVAEMPKKKLSYKQQRLLETLPAEITVLEEEIAALQKQLHDPDFYRTSPDDFHNAIGALEKKKAILAEKEEHYLEIALLADEIK